MVVAGKGADGVGQLFLPLGRILCLQKRIQQQAFKLHRGGHIAKAAVCAGKHRKGRLYLHRGTVYLHRPVAAKNVPQHAVLIDIFHRVGNGGVVHRQLGKALFIQQVHPGISGPNGADGKAAVISPTDHRRSRRGGQSANHGALHHQSAGFHRGREFLQPLQRHIGKAAVVGNAGTEGIVKGAGTEPGGHIGFCTAGVIIVGPGTGAAAAVKHGQHAGIIGEAVAEAVLAVTGDHFPAE